MSDNYLKKELYELIKTDDSIFDFIQEGSLDGLWYWDLENPENEWMNAKFWTVLGYNPDEMPHKSSAWQSIIHPDDLKKATDNFIRHCQNPGYPYDQIVRYTHRDGSTVWIRCRGMAIRDQYGKPIRMLGAHHTITEFKNSEYSLQQNLRFQKIITEISSDFVKASSKSFDSDINKLLARIGNHLLADRAYLILFSDDLDTMSYTHEWCNEGAVPRMKKTHNLSTDSFPWWKSQIISNNFVHVPDVEELPEEAAAEKKEFRSQKIKSLICLRIKSTDKVWGVLGFDSEKKQHIWKDTDINSLAITANLIANLLLRLHDTQILLEARKAVEKSELKFRGTEEALRQSNFVVENIQIGLYIYHLEDTDDDSTLRMKYANPATESMTGVKAVDIIGKTLDENFPYLRDMNFPQRYAEVVRSGKEKTFEDLFYGDDRVVQACFSVKAFPLPNNHLGIAFENITEKVTIQQAVEQSNARLKEAQEVGGVGSWEYDMITGNLIWSEQTYRIYGEERDTFNVTFDNVIAHYPDGDREEVLAAFNKTVTERSELRIEHRILTGTGETRNVHEIGRLIISEDGTPMRIVGSVVDITERTKAEEKLLTQAGLISSLLDNIPDIIFFKDKEGIYLGCNPHFAEFVGKRREDIIGKSDYDLFNKETADFFRYHDREILKLLKVRQNDEWITYPDGRRILIDTLKAPYYDQNGGLIGILGISRDITERYHAEQEISKFKIMSDNAVEGKAIANLDGHLVYINKFLADIHGYTEEELTGKHLSVFHTPHQMEEVGATLAELYRLGLRAPRYWTCSSQWDRVSHAHEWHDYL